MACTKNRSKIWTDGISVFLVITVFMLPNHAWGAFASQFSLTVGEGYSDNIFFTKQKEHDFATIIVPTFSLLYAPEGQVTPTLSLSVSPNGQIFARHSELSNFGENVVFNGARSTANFRLVVVTFSAVQQLRFNRNKVSETAG